MTVDTAELRRLRAAATPGPWAVVREEPQLDTTDSGAKAWIEIGNVETGEMVADCTPNFRDHPSSWEGASRSEADEQAQADAALIVAAMNALPVLLDRLDAYREALNVSDLRFVRKTLWDHSTAERPFPEAIRIVDAMLDAALDTEQP